MSAILLYVVCGAGIAFAILYVPNLICTIRQIVRHYKYYLSDPDRSKMDLILFNSEVDSVFNIVITNIYNIPGINLLHRLPKSLVFAYGAVMYTFVVGPVRDIKIELTLLAILGGCIGFLVALYPFFPPLPF